MSGRIAGIAGLGIMGGAIASNLLERGWTVYGHDVAPEKPEALSRLGLRICPGPAALAQETPVILTSLPSGAAARAVAADIAGSGAPSRIVIEASTLSLEDKFAVEALLGEAGHIALDCPLSGTGAQAKTRDLVVYASGDADAIAQCSPLFDDFARLTENLGGFGNGSRMKFIANLLVAIHNAAAAEALLLAERAGMDLTRVVETIGTGAGSSRMFQMRAPLMAEGAYEPATMRNSTWRKDLDVIGAFAAELGCPAPLFAVTQDMYAKTLDMGLGDQDTAAVFEAYRRIGGKADAE